MNIPLLQTYSVNNITVLRLQCAPEFAIMRARARPHTLAPPGLLPLTESGGRRPWGARVVWVVEYMCIYEPGHIRCRCRFRTRCRFRPDPSLRFAALRGRVFEPRFEAGPSQAPGSLRPCGVRVRALRRWGAGRPRVLAGSWLQAERLSSGRRVEARSASLRSVNTPAPRASQRPRAPMAVRPIGLRSGAGLRAAAPSCRGEARTCPSEAV